jgi:hypothetical protein
MRWLQLHESSIPERHSLPDDVATALNQLDIATVTPAGGGDWTIANIRKVGVVRVADCQIAIHPKVPVARLFFMTVISGTTMTSPSAATVKAIW